MPSLARGPFGPVQHAFGEGDAQPLAQRAQMRLRGAQEIAGVDDRRRRTGGAEFVVQRHLLRQADVVGGDRGPRFHVRRHHFARIADQQHVAQARDPRMVHVRQQVVGHVLLVPDRCAARRRPQQGVHHATPVGVAIGDHFLARRMVQPGVVQVVRVQRLVADRAVAAVFPGPHHRRGDVARPRPHRHPHDVGRGARSRRSHAGRTRLAASAAANARYSDCRRCDHRPARVFAARHLADLAAVDRTHRHHAAEGAGDEGFVGAIHIGQAEGLLQHRDVVLPAEGDDVGAGDPAQAVLPGRGPHLALAHDEEVGGIAGGDETVRVQHQRLVRAGAVGLDAGGDAVELAVRIELGVLHVRRAAAHVHGEQRQSARGDVRGSGLVLGNDDDGRRTHGHARILVGRAFHPAGDHQAHMHAIAMHAVGVEGGVDRAGQLRAVQADVEQDRLGAFVQPVQVRIQEQRMPAEHAEPFPDAVAKHETAVEHRHHRLAAVLHHAVDGNEDVGVARIVGRMLGALGHA